MNTFQDNSNNRVQRRTSSDGNISQAQSGESGSGTSEDSPEAPFVIEISSGVVGATNIRLENVQQDIWNSSRTTQLFGQGVVELPRRPEFRQIVGDG